MTMPKFKLTYIDATTGECHRARLQVDPRFGIDVRALRGDPENRKPPITYKPTTNDLEMMARDMIPQAEAIMVKHIGAKRWLITFTQGKLASVGMLTQEEQ